MRDIDSSILAIFAQRTGIVARTLFWISARNRTTNAIETLGVWNGAQPRTFTIDGDSRVYQAGGSLLGFGEYTQETGTNIRKLTAKINPISPQFIQAVREFDARLAPVEVHVAMFSTETNELVGTPIRVFKGWVDKAPSTIPAKNNVNSASFEMVSNSRILTRLLGTKKSKEGMKRRHATDAFYDYSTLSGTITTPWGERGAGSRSRGSSTTATPAVNKPGLFK